MSWIYPSLSFFGRPGQPAPKPPDPGAPLILPARIVEVRAFPADSCAVIPLAEVVAESGEDAFTVRAGDQTSVRVRFRTGDRELTMAFTVLEAGRLCSEVREALVRLGAAR